MRIGDIMKIIIDKVDIWFLITIGGKLDTEVAQESRWTHHFLQNFNSRDRVRDIWEMVKVHEVKKDCGKVRVRLADLG